jgi:hypothetical protein
MRIELKRTTYTPQSTIGELLVDGKFVCYTLEDQVRAPGVKVWGKTAIPSGAYEVKVTMSPRFKRPLPLLLNVPNYEGVRIHCGNKAEDTEGCILVGTAKAVDWISNSKVAFDKLFPMIDDACKAREAVTLVITDNPVLAEKVTKRAKK